MDNSGAEDEPLDVIWRFERGGQCLFISTNPVTTSADGRHGAVGGGEQNCVGAPSALLHKAPDPAGAGGLVGEVPGLGCPFQPVRIRIGVVREPGESRQTSATAPSAAGSAAPVRRAASAMLVAVNFVIVNSVVVHRVVVVSAIARGVVVRRMIAPAIRAMHVPRRVAVVVP